MKYITNIAVATSLLVGSAGLSAVVQSQSKSTPGSQSGSSSSESASSGQALGDYARQVRKGGGAPSKPKVFDNDNLPKEDKLSVVGTAREAPRDTTLKADDTASAAPATPAASGDAKTSTDAKNESKPAAESSLPKSSEGDQAAKEAAWKQWTARISAQKDSVDLLNRELDVLQREYQIRAAAMYADAGNRLRNSGDWDKTDTDYKQRIADKQKAVDDAKQRLDDLQEDARKAGVPASVREP
jgi:hypothetical protein